jgi:cell fate regulator YaaT (PSP1 superfamily)
MAKEQNLALNPAKISGICGRLMCCLTYEYDTYMQLKKGMPKCGKRVCTRCGEGKVVRQNVMNRRFSVLFPDGHEQEMTPEDIVPADAAPPKPAERPERPERPAQAGRPRKPRKQQPAGG